MIAGSLSICDYLRLCVAAQSCAHSRAQLHAIAQPRATDYPVIFLSFIPSSSVQEKSWPSRFAFRAFRIRAKVWGVIG